VLGIVMMGGVGAATSVFAAEAINEAFVRTAHSKGLSPLLILRRHLLRAILPGLVVYISTQMVFLLSGAVITEVLFSRPGVGRLLLDAVLRQDFPIVQGVVVWTTAIVMLVTTVGEWLRRLFDPRLGE
jgi:ABC-type dipeptide/oligopeptide/nickel transport system permease component